MTLRFAKRIARIGASVAYASIGWLVSKEPNAHSYKAYPLAHAAQALWIAYTNAGTSAFCTKDGCMQ